MRVSTWVAKRTAEAVLLARILQRSVSTETDSVRSLELIVNKLEKGLFRAITPTMSQLDNA